MSEGKCHEWVQNLKCWFVCAEDPALEMTKRLMLYSGYCPTCGDRLLPGGAVEPRLERVLEKMAVDGQMPMLHAMESSRWLLYLRDLRHSVEVDEYGRTQEYPDPARGCNPIAAVLAALAALEETGSVERPKAFLPPKDGEPSGWGQAVIDSLAAPEGEKSDAD